MLKGVKVDLAVSFAEPFLTSYERWNCSKKILFWLLASQNLSSQVMKGGIAAKRYYFGS